MEALLTPGVFKIELDGKPLSGSDARFLVAVRVCQRLSVPSQCELTFQGLFEEFGEISAVVAGAHLLVQLENSPRVLFQGYVSAIEYDFSAANAQSVQIRGYDKLHSLRKRQSPRSYVDLTVTELAENLMSDLEISVDALESGPVWRHIMQHDQSDLELLTEFSERAGLYFILSESVLYFLSLQGLGTTQTLSLGGNLLEAKIEVNSDKSCHSVTNLAWDPWAAQAHVGKAGSARSGRQTDATDAITRAAVMTEYTSTNENAQADDQAEVFAQAQLDHREAAKATFWGIASGNPELCPGTTIRISGLASQLNGAYVLSSVIHSFDRQQGYIAELDTRPPVLQSRKRATLATVGLVTRVDDPENAGRIKVSLPAYGELETDWIAVACVAAGPDKGFLALPSLGDKVLLALIREDPAQAIVLGGLYGGATLPDDVIVDGDVGRYLLYTAGGQQLCLDDKAQSIRLKTATGHSAELSPDKIRLELSTGSFFELANAGTRLHAEGNLQIEAPGHTITISGQAINFEQK